MLHATFLVCGMNSRKYRKDISNFVRVNLLLRVTQRNILINWPGIVFGPSLAQGSGVVEAGRRDCLLVIGIGGLVG